MKLFSVIIGGAEYGIDAAKVAGVGDSVHPTPVPGSPPHLLGLQNMGGEVVPVIDLRILLRIPAEHAHAGMGESTVLVRTEKASACVVVDSVRGIAESGPSVRPLDMNLVLFGEPLPADARPALDEWLGPLRDGLLRFASFTVSEINGSWVGRRYPRWAKSRERLGKPAAIEGPGDAAEFLRGFASPSVGRLWDRELRDVFLVLLRGRRTGSFTVLNRGCGKGFDAFSIACIIASARPALRGKIWADGDDLAAMVAAPSLSLDRSEIPGYLLRSGSLIEARGRFVFSPKIREMIVFSFAEVCSPIECPPADLIVARDVLSFLGEEQQEKLLGAFASALRPGGVLVTGWHERPPTREWRAVSRGKLPAFRPRNSVGQQEGP